MEAAFAQELDALMRNNITAHEAVCGWEAACVAEARRLQDLASAFSTTMPHAAPNASFYGAQAEAMWEEACTWKLMRCLFSQCATSSVAAALCAAHRMHVVADQTLAVEFSAPSPGRCCCWARHLDQVVYDACIFRQRMLRASCRQHHVCAERTQSWAPAQCSPDPPLRH